MSLDIDDTFLARLHPALRLRYGPDLDTACLYLSLFRSRFFARAEKTSGRMDAGKLLALPEGSGEPATFTPDEASFVLALLLESEGFRARPYEILWTDGRGTDGRLVACVAAYGAEQVVLDPVMGAAWLDAQGRPASGEQLAEQLLGESVNWRFHPRFDRRGDVIPPGATTGEVLSGWGLPPGPAAAAIVFQIDPHTSRRAPIDLQAFGDKKAAAKLAMRTKLDCSGAKANGTGLILDPAADPKGFTGSLFAAPDEAPPSAGKRGRFATYQTRPVILFEGGYGFVAARERLEVEAGAKVRLGVLGRQLEAAGNSQVSGFYVGLACMDAQGGPVSNAYQFQKLSNDLSPSDGWIETEIVIVIDDETRLVRPYAGMNYSGGEPSANGVAALARIEACAKS